MQNFLTLKKPSTPEIRQVSGTEEQIEIEVMNPIKKAYGYELDIFWYDEFDEREQASMFLHIGENDVHVETFSTAISGRLLMSMNRIVFF